MPASASIQIKITAAGKLYFGVGVPSSTTVYNSNSITGVQTFTTNSAPPPSVLTPALQPCQAHLPPLYLARGAAPPTPHSVNAAASNPHPRPLQPGSTPA